MDLCRPIAIHHTHGGRHAGFSNEPEQKSNPSTVAAVVVGRPDDPEGPPPSHQNPVDVPKVA